MTRLGKTHFERYVSGANRAITLIVANHLWMEHLLLRCLATVLKNLDALIRNGQPSFVSLAGLCEAHGIIEEDFATVLRKANSLRNRYAHRLAFEPQGKEVGELLASLAQMRHPFLIDRTPPTENAMLRALASVSGFLEKRAMELGAKMDEGPNQEVHRIPHPRRVRKR